MTPLGWKWAGFVWGYAIVWALINDRIKLLAYQIFDPVKAETKGEPKPETKADAPTPEAKAEPKPEAKADALRLKPSLTSPSLKPRPSRSLRSKLMHLRLHPKLSSRNLKPGHLPICRHRSLSEPTNSTRSEPATTVPQFRTGRRQSRKFGMMKPKGVKARSQSGRAEEA